MQQPPTGIILCAPGEEPPPAGKPGHRPIDATTPAGAAEMRRINGSEATRRKLAELQRRYATRRTAFGRG